MSTEILRGGPCWRRLHHRQYIAADDQHVESSGIAPESKNRSRMGHLRV